MRYWWVNQSQTYLHEMRGGFLWSPKRKTDGKANPFYDFMREVAPNDVVFSFADGAIKAISFVVSHAYEAPKPMEFGAAGAYWNMIGWRVDVHYNELRHSEIRPVDHMHVLRPPLPKKYSPVRENGYGQQSMYLTKLSDEFAGALVDLIGFDARLIIQGNRVAEPLAESVAIGQVQWEEHEIEQVRSNTQMEATQREAIVLARRGHGLFKTRVGRIERACRVTKVDRIEHLRASHCKPWRDSNDEERLDGENGLLLTPSIDHLFDRGFISFDANGDVLVSPVAHSESLERMGVHVHGVVNVGGFSSGQAKFLEYHRENVYLRSRFLQ